ncbi:MAG: hypothetical protein WDW38_004820 [Sanguina aurantia]
MSSERSKRTIVPPKRFTEDATVASLCAEYYYDTVPLVLSSNDGRVRPPMRKVYRLLKRKDISKSLHSRKVHLFWPEDGGWYEAVVQEIRVKLSQAYVHYPGNDDYEEIDLAQLISDKQIAVVEERPPSVRLHSYEIPVDPAAQPPVEYHGSSSDDVSSDEDGGVSSDSSDQPLLRPPQGIPSAAAAAAAAQQLGAGHSMHTQVQRPAKRVRDSDSLDRQQQQQQQAGSTGRKHSAGGETSSSTAHLDPDVAEAEAFKTALLGAIMHRMEPTANPHASTPVGHGGGGPRAGQPGSRHVPPTDSSRGGGGSRGGQHHSQEAGGSGRGLKKQGSGGGGSETELRRKVTEQLTTCLSKAGEELAAEGYDERLPLPVDVAAEVEQQLYTLHGGLNAEYKAKFRSLIFNMRDAANPELRARVLRGELTPPVLVTMGAAELASRTLSEWRCKRQEEATKAVFLDSETAAKFSTAAAASLSASRVAAKLAHPATTYDPTAIVIDTSEPPATDPDQDPDAKDDDMADQEASGDPDSSHHGMDLARAESGSVSGSRRPSLSGSKRSSLDSGMDAGGDGSDHHASLHTSPGDGLAFGSPAGGSRNGGGPASSHMLSGTSSSFGSASAPGTQQPQRASLAAETAPLASTPEEAAADDSIADMLHDAPYDPESYNLDSIYDPAAELGDDEDAAAAAAPPLDLSTSSSALDRRASDSGGAHATAGAVVRASAHLGQAQHQPHGERGGGPSGDAPSAAAAEVLDMSPIIARPDEAPAGVRLAVPGDKVYVGPVAVMGMEDVSVTVSYLAGIGMLGSMLTSVPEGTSPFIKGQVRGSKVELFLEELRRSKNRTVTLGAVSLAAGASPGQAAAMHELTRPPPHAHAPAVGSAARTRNGARGHATSPCWIGDRAATGDRRLCSTQHGRCECPPPGLPKLLSDAVLHPPSPSLPLPPSPPLPPSLPTGLHEAEQDGVCTPVPALEAYFVACGHLSARMLRTARMASPPSQVHLLPSNIAENQLLLVMIHRRDWRPEPNHRTSQLHPQAQSFNLASLPHQPPFAQQLFFNNAAAGTNNTGSAPMLSAAQPQPQGAGTLGLQSQQQQQLQQLLQLQQAAASAAGSSGSGSDPRSAGANGNSAGSAQAAPAGGLPSGISLESISALAALMGLSTGGGSSNAAPAPAPLKQQQAQLPAAPLLDPNTQMVVRQADGTLVIVNIPPTGIMPQQQQQFGAPPPLLQHPGPPPPNYMPPPPPLLILAAGSLGTPPGPVQLTSPFPGQSIFAIPPPAPPFGEPGQQGQQGQDPRRMNNNNNGVCISVSPARPAGWRPPPGPPRPPPAQPNAPFNHHHHHPEQQQQQQHQQHQPYDFDPHAHQHPPPGGFYDEHSMPYEDPHHPAYNHPHEFGQQQQSFYDPNVAPPHPPPYEPYPHNNNGGEFHGGEEQNQHHQQQQQQHGAGRGGRGGRGRRGRGGRQ